MQNKETWLIIINKVSNIEKKKKQQITDPISINETSIKQTDVIEQTTKYLPNVPCPLHESQTKQPLVRNFYHGIIIIVLYLKNQTH